MPLYAQNKASEHTVVIRESSHIFCSKNTRLACRDYFSGQNWSPGTNAAPDKALQN